MDFVIIAAIGFLMGGLTGAAWGIVGYAIFLFLFALLVGR